MSDDTFTFSWIVNETPEARLIRCCEELLGAYPDGISEQASQHPNRLRSFINISTDPSGVIGIIAGKNVKDYAPVRTNCAVTCHAFLCWCGDVMRPYLNGEPITAYVELSKQSSAWIPNDGTNKPDGPCIAYVEPSARLAFDHVKILGALQADGVTYTAYQGGGGDGTHIAKGTARIDVPDSYGRRTSGWWRIAPLLPPYVTIGGPADDTTEPTITGISGAAILDAVRLFRQQH